MYKVELNLPFDKYFNAANNVYGCDKEFFRSLCKYSPIELADIDENLYLPILRDYGIDITWEDIENNERLYRLLQEAINIIGYYAFETMFFDMARDVYDNEFENNAIKFLNDKNNEFYGYITIDDVYIGLFQDDFNVHYSYEDEDVMEFFGDEEDYTNIEKARKEFEDIINELIIDKLQELDDYIGSKIVDMFGYGKFSFDINKKQDYSYFKDYLKGSLNFGFFFDGVKREVAKMKRGELR